MDFSHTLSDCSASALHYHYVCNKGLVREMGLPAHLASFALSFHRIHCVSNYM